MCTNCTYSCGQNGRNVEEDLEILFLRKNKLQNVIDIQAKMEYDFATSKKTLSFLQKNNFRGKHI